MAIPAHSLACTLGVRKDHLMFANVVSHGLSLCALSVSLICCGCDRGPKSGFGFTLPEGNPTRGAEVFEELACNACHVVTGIDQLETLTGEPEASIPLGGEVARIKTYGELVTAIINPSHRFAKGYAPEEVATPEGESRMPIYNEMMTVSELTDLVAFLQSKYKLRPIQPSPYTPYY